MQPIGNRLFLLIFSSQLDSFAAVPFRGHWKKSWRACFLRGCFPVLFIHLLFRCVSQTDKESFFAALLHAPFIIPNAAPPLVNRGILPLKEVQLVRRPVWVQPSPWLLNLHLTLTHSGNPLIRMFFLFFFLWAAVTLFQPYRGSSHYCSRMQVLPWKFRLLLLVWSPPPVVHVFVCVSPRVRTPKQQARTRTRALPQVLWSPAAL